MITKRGLNKKYIRAYIRVFENQNPIQIQSNAKNSNPIQIQTNPTNIQSKSIWIWIGFGYPTGAPNHGIH